MFAILEYPGGPALSVGYRHRTAAETALQRLRRDDPRYASHIVAETGPTPLLSAHDPGAA